MQNRDNDDNFDERGLLRDGATYHVPLRFCDFMQRDVAKHAQSIKPSRQHITDASGNDGLAALNRPGYRILSGGAPKTQAAWDALNHATEQAYALDEHFKQNAWKDTILDVSDEDEVYEATQEAKAADCYQDYATEISQEWRRGNHE